MRYDNLGGFKSIDKFVGNKIDALIKSDKSMRSLYELMFSESENVMFEETDGFRIKKTTYGQVKATVEEISPDIRRKVDSDNGSVIGVYMDNCPLMIAVFWAILKAGYKPLLVNKRLPDETVENTLKELNAVAVVSDGKIFSIKTVKALDLRKSDDTNSDVPFGDEFFVMSSGTNSVKVCAYTSAQVVPIIENSAYILRHNKTIKKHYNGELKLLTLLPFYHIFGFEAVYLWFAFFSRTFVLLKDLSPATVQNTIKKHKVTHVFAVPLYWNTVKNRAVAEIKTRGEKTVKKFGKGMSISAKLGNSLLGNEFKNIAFKEVREKLFGESVRCMISGGSPIPKETLEFFNGIGYSLVNGYGMSEIGITSVELSSRYKAIVDCSIGKPFPSVAYKIESGVLYVKGTSVASYVIDRGKKISLENEWYKTEDLATEKSGRYYLSGRKDDLIISVTGENLNPNLIERKLSVDGVEESCLIGGTDGSLPVFLVYLGKKTDENFVNDVTERIKIAAEKNNLVSQIGKICIVSQPLIKGEEFKLNRKRIKSDYYGGKIKTVGHDNGNHVEKTDEISEKVREYFAVALGKNVADVGYNTDFFLDEGGTSIDYFALVAKLQQDYGVDFPSTAENGINTVDGVARYIRERI